MYDYNTGDTIVALATPKGTGAIAVVRLSGKDAVSLTANFFSGNKDLQQAAPNTVHYGKIHDESGNIIDEVLVSIFKAPKSYTGEDVVEISCHASPYIIRELLRLFIANGARPAKEGEFTMRAFLNGKMDLSQAEAVADLITSKTKLTHDIALKQMKGGFSSEIKILREKLLEFMSLIELELDFSEEDVEFADRDQLRMLVKDILTKIEKLKKSFELGNVLKNGVPVVITGRPNAGKSTLLNALLNDDRAIVSEIAGTTRDTIEEELNIDGILFRFIDTAGIRKAKDKIESLGIEKTMEKIQKAALVVYIYDITAQSGKEVKEDLASLNIPQDTPVLTVANKIDKFEGEFIPAEGEIALSAKNKYNLENLKSAIYHSVINNELDTGDTIVTNERHYHLLSKAYEVLGNVLAGLDEAIPGDLLALDIRQANIYLGEITGTISTDDILGNIFGKFCIGK